MASSIGDGMIDRTTAVLPDESAATQSYSEKKADLQMSKQQS